MSEPEFFPEDTHVSVRRLIAHWVDGIVISLLTIVPAALIAGAVHAAGFGLVFTVVGFLVSLVYFVELQARNGRTPGKQLCGIRVVDAHGRTPNRGALVRRTVPLFFEWLGLVAWVGILSSRYRQRLGDRWAHTYVVED